MTHTTLTSCAQPLPQPALPSPPSSGAPLQPVTSLTSQDVTPHAVHHLNPDWIPTLPQMCRLSFLQPPLTQPSHCGGATPHPPLAPCLKSVDRAQAPGQRLGSGCLEADPGTGLGSFERQRAGTGLGRGRGWACSRLQNVSIRPGTAHWRVPHWAQMAPSVTAWLLLADSHGSCLLQAVGCPRSCPWAASPSWKGHLASASL